jgi:hypothetical protein
VDLIRNTPAALLAALAGPAFFPVVLVDVDWPGGRIRAHGNAGPITWDGRTFQGVGKFGAIDVPQEGMGGVPEEFTMSLTCDLPELAEYADAVIRGRPGSVYLGATATRGGADLIGAVGIVSGTCDGLVLRSEVVGDDGQTFILYTLTVTFSAGPGWRAMSAVAHSDEDQSRAFPGDTAGRHLLTAQADAEVTLWPEP